MDFRRIPFQFTSTDPAKRQAELQKRFGLPVNTNKDNMYIDLANPGLVGTRTKEPSSATSSPRLQHRVPIFVEGSPEPIKPSVDSHNNADTSRKPHVRMIPIEIEGEDNSKRHRTLSGPVDSVKDRPHQNGSWLSENLASYMKPFMPKPKPNSSVAPHKRNIPVKIEGVNQSKVQTQVPVQKDKPAGQKKYSGLKQNGCNVSKVDIKANQSGKPLDGPALSLKKIEGVLEKLKMYQLDVENFSGTSKEKRYKYLDEMLTRCMLELDDVDTIGNETVRLSRKAAIRQVQVCVDLLELKVTKGVTQMKETVDDSNNVVEDKSNEIEVQPGGTQDRFKVGNEGSATSSNSNMDPCKMNTGSVYDVVFPAEEKISDVELKERLQIVPEIEDKTADIRIMEVDEATPDENVSVRIVEEPKSSASDCSLQVDLESLGECDKLDIYETSLKLSEHELDIIPDSNEKEAVQIFEQTVAKMKTDTEVSSNTLPDSTECGNESATSPSEVRDQSCEQRLIA